MAAQKKMTSFFSSKSTPVSPFDDKKTSPFAKKPSTDIPENVLKEKTPNKTPNKNKIIEKVKKETTPKDTKKPSLKKSPKEKTPKSIEKKLKSVTISEPVKPIKSPAKESSPSPPSSPCNKPSKRRRVCVIAESDSEEDVAENISPKKVTPPSTPKQSTMEVSDTEKAPSPPKAHVTPKRKTAKLSKDFRSKIKNQTPHPIKGSLSRQGSVAEPMETDVSLTEELCDEDVKEEPVKSPAKSEAMWDDVKEASEEDEPQPKKSKPAKSPKLERKSPKKETKSPKPKAPVKKASPETKPKKKDLSAFSFKKKETLKAEPTDVKPAPSKPTASKPTTTADYKPGKAGYKPIEDACWKKGEVVPYKALAYTMQVRLTD